MTAPYSPNSSFDADMENFLQPSRLHDLRGRLVDEGRDALDVTWFTHDTPVGPLMIAARERAIVRIAFECEDFSRVTEQLVSALGSRCLRSDRGVENVRDQLDEYFAGTRKDFSIPIDRVLTRTPYRSVVQQHLPEIHYGTTWSYQELAATSGRPKAVRAAATACATNPLPLVVPCHRVVRSDGTVGAYLGGSETKKWLLEFEASHRHPFDADLSSTR